MGQTRWAGLAGIETFVPPALLGLLAAGILAAGAFGWQPLWPTATTTISEAIALKDRATALDLIVRGQDPNARYHVREGVVGERSAELTPLEAAITTREIYVVQFLFDHGAVVNDGNRRLLVCSALLNNAPAVASLFNGGDPGAIDCAGVKRPW